MSAGTKPTKPVPTAVESAKPTPPTGWEKAGAVVLMTAGIVLVALMLAGFSTDGFSFKSKEITTTEPIAETGTGTETAESTAGKTTSETDFADTVAIFGLTLGGALVLAGAFYARIRSIKLGGLELGLVGDEQKKEVQDKAEEKVEGKVTDPAKQKAAKAVAGPIAAANLDKIALLGISPTDQMIDAVAEQAAHTAAKAVS